MNQRAARRPVPAAGRAATAGLVLVAAAWAFGDALAATRLRTLALLIRPVETLLAPVDHALPAAPSRLPGPGFVTPPGSTAIPVLDVRPGRGTLLIGAGSESGIVVGETVTAGDALVGFVERIESHVARVRTFTGGDASVAVAGADARPSKSGALVRHVGLVVAGSPPRLMKSPMPEAFRVDERLVTVGGEGSRVPPGLRVGDVVETGIAPAVRLAVDPVGVGRVTIPRRLEGLPRLFHDEPVTVVASPLDRRGGALIGGPGLADAVPGVAFTIEGRFLGRLLETSSDAARVSLVGDVGHDVVARWIDDLGQEGEGVLTCVGAGLYTLRQTRGALPGFAFWACTAGGQALIPQGLVIGRFAPENGSWRLSEPIRTPRRGVVPIFLESKEHRRLHPEVRTS